MSETIIETPPIDLEAERAAAIADHKKNETARRKDIRALAEQATGKCKNVRELMEKAIDGETTAEDFRVQVLDSICAQAQAVENAGDGLSKRERKDLTKFSLSRLISNIAEERKQDGIEREVIEEGLKEKSRLGLTMRGNVYIPTLALRAQRDVNVTTEGADIVQTTVDTSFIGLLRNRMLLRDLGARYLTGLTGDLQFPRVSAGASASWVAENTASGESTQTTDNVSISPNALRCFTELSRQAVIQSNPDIDAMIQDDLVTALALAIDAAGINGSGSGSEPTGILNTGSIGDYSIGANGGAPTWASVVEPWKDVSAANADMGSLAYLTSASVVGKLLQTPKVASTDSNMIMNNLQDGILGYRVGVSNQVPDDLTDGTGTALSALIFGNFNDLIIGQFGGLDLLVNPYIKDTEGLIRLTAWTFADVAVRHPESFSACQDIDAS